MHISRIAEATANLKGWCLKHAHVVTMYCAALCQWLALLEAVTAKFAT
jgi:hypothetical protein